MKFYNPFSLHIVYNEQRDQYAARKWLFGWTYMDMSSSRISREGVQFFHRSKGYINQWCYNDYITVVKLAKDYKYPTKPKNNLFKETV